MTKKRSQDDMLGDLGLLRSRETSLQNGHDREVVHLKDLKKLRLPDAERKVERAQEHLVSARQELARAGGAVTTAKTAKGEAVAGPVINRPFETIVEWRESQLSEAKEKVGSADNTYGRVRLQHVVMEAQRALDNAVGISQGHDAAIAACDARVQLWQAAVDKGIPGDIATAQAELQDLHDQIDEQSARIGRALVAVELTADEIRTLEIEVCEPLIGSEGMAS